MDVRIRRYSVGDSQSVLEAVRESLVELRSWMPWAHAAYSLEESRAWLRQQVPAFDHGTAFEFAIVSGEGRYLGGCGLNQIDHANRRANLGYWVRSTATGRGVATAAVHALREWAFANTALIRLEIVVAAGNAASHRVAEKTGAVREGTLRSRLILHGAVHDATMFSFARDEAGASNA
jgi:RimJ/RimL family protein N-acetyltransferase